MRVRRWHYLFSVGGDDEKNGSIWWTMEPLHPLGERADKVQLRDFPAGLTLLVGDSVGSFSGASRG